MCLETWFCLSKLQHAVPVEAPRHSPKSSDTCMSQGAVPKVGEKPATAVGPGERDDLLITDTDVGAKGEACKEAE